MIRNIVDSLSSQDVETSSQMSEYVTKFIHYAITNVIDSHI